MDDLNQQKRIDFVLEHQEEIQNLCRTRYFDTMVLRLWESIHVIRGRLDLIEEPSARKAEMRTLEEAQKSMARTTFNEEQRARSQQAWHAAGEMLKVLFETAKPSPELTLACRALEECTMWHSKAISNESKE